MEPLPRPAHERSATGRGVLSVLFNVDPLDDAHAQVLNRGKVNVEHGLGQARGSAKQDDLPRAGADIVDRDRRTAPG